MRYYKFQDEESLVGSGTRYIETEEGHAVREVTVAAGAFLATNIKYPEWGFMLSEGQIDCDVIEGLSEITENEFAQVWDAHLARNLGRWLVTKLAYPVGTPVKGRLAVLYPQGVLIDLGDAVVGVANHDECRSSAKPEDLYPGHAASGVVSGYDERNHWLILSQPQVHPVR